MAENDLKYKTKQGLYWTFINQFANTGLSFFVGIIIARLLSPSDYGITALPAVFIVIANIFIESGFSNAMVRKPDLKDEDLSTAFIYSASVGLICYIIIFIGAPWIANFYNEPILTPLVRVTALSFLWSPLATPQNIILQRKLDFKTPAKIVVTTRIIGAVVGVTCAYLGYGLWALVAMSVVSSFLNFMLTWLVVKWKPTTGWSKESFHYLWGFGNKMVGVAIIDCLYNNIAPIVIGKFYSVAELGVYNRAKGYSDLPSVQGTHVIQQVTFPVLSRLQDNNEALAKNYRRMLKLSSFIIFPIMTMFAALAKPLIIILLTDKWADSIILLQILCFAAMWYPIHAINLNLLTVKGRSDLFLKLEIYKKAIAITLLACTLPFGLIYFVSAGIVTSFICFFINTYFTGKLINVGFVTQIKDLLPTFCLSMLVFVVILSINQFVDILWEQLIFGGIAGIVIYLGGAIFFKFGELNDVSYMLSRKA